MLNLNKSLLLLVGMLLSLLPLVSDKGTTHAGWQDILQQASDVFTKGDNNLTLNKEALSIDQIASGLKQALTVGVKNAIEILGKENGFLNDINVKIPMPEQLQQTEKLLRQFGQHKIADNFVLSMNRAAESAVPKVTPILIDAISNLTLTDAQAILNGPDNAATTFFEQHTRKQLAQLISPLVENAMDNNQVTNTYQTMLSKIKQYDNFGLLNTLVDKDALDLNQYVTNKTLDGLFSKLAEQEQLIRENPAARTTDLLKAVFGSLNK